MKLVEWAEAQNLYDQEYEQREHLCCVLLVPLGPVALWCARFFVPNECRVAFRCVAVCQRKKSTKRWPSKEQLSVHNIYNRIEKRTFDEELVMLNIFFCLSFFRFLFPLAHRRTKLRAKSWWKIGAWHMHLALTIALTLLAPPLTRRFATFFAALALIVRPQKRAEQKELQQQEREDRQQRYKEMMAQREKGVFVCVARPHTG